MPVRVPVSSDADVAVVGGGPAGTATAIELARLGLTVTVLERSGYDTVRIGETLPPAIAPRLARLGVWQGFLDQGHLPSYAVRSAWGSDVVHDMPHMFNPYGKGFHVDRAAFDSLLAQRARNVGAEVHANSRVVAIDRSARGDWRVIFDDADERRAIHARYLVDASGRGSRFRRKFDIDDEVHDRLVGIAVWFEGDTAASLGGSYTLIESVESGWWYSAPIPNDKLIVVFMCDLDSYRDGRRRSARYWYERLEETRHTRTRIAPMRSAATPRVYLAHSHHVVRLGDTGWLPVGDSMQAVDPLSGQGACNAFLMAEQAAVAIAGYFDGRPGAVSDYLAQTNDDFGRYLDTRQYYYAKETRWPKSSYWRRRTAPARPWVESWPRPRARNAVTTA